MKTAGWLGAATAMGLLAITVSARADDGPLSAPPEPLAPSGAEPIEPKFLERQQPVTPAIRKRSRRGTHFIGELRVGSTVDGAGDFAYGGVLGVGGRWYGLPPIYLIGAVDHTSTGRTGRGSDGFASQHLSLTSVGAGLRLYVPIADPFRFMAEISVGAAATRASHDDGTNLAVEDLWLPYTELGFGPQFRVLHELSLGARASIAFMDTSALERSGPASGWEGALTRRSTVLGNVTLHF